jgi:hypothetical protein
MLADKKFGSCNVGKEEPENPQSFSKRRFYSTVGNGKIGCLLKWNLFVVHTCMDEARDSKP